MTSNNFLNKLAFFNGEVYAYWKEKIIFFIEAMSCDIWDVVKNSSFCSHSHQFNDVAKNEPKYLWIKEDK